MNRNRLNKIEKKLKPNLNNCNLLAIEHVYDPENNRYSMWNGTQGSNKQITKEEFEELSQQMQSVKIVRGNVARIIDDIPDTRKIEGK